jgi:hypothetical protein
MIVYIVSYISYASSFINILGRCPCVATVYKIFNKMLVHKKEHIFQLHQKRYIPRLQG